MDYASEVGSGSNAILEVTCTANVLGPIPIDCWYKEVHFLTLEGGA